MKVASVRAREILDSRGNPTVEVDLWLEDGSMGRAAVPSGASTGIHEALELRDGDVTRYGGQGVTKAVQNVNKAIAAEIVANDFADIFALDKVMLDLDGTANKSNLGANAILGVSIAFVQAMAKSMHMPTWKLISQLYGSGTPMLPRPMFNIMNGGRHANWSTDIQEFMVVPMHQSSFKEAVRMGSEIFHSLEKVLKNKGLSINIGNEGGFAPQLTSNTEALDLIVQAIEGAGYRPGEDVGMGFDIASSEFFIENGAGEGDDQYELKTEKRKLGHDEWEALIMSWIAKYPIVTIEDPYSQDAWDSWSAFLAKTAGTKVEQVVGDDLLVTNVERIKTAIEKKSCNALLVKLNQIGSVSETLNAMHLSEQAGWKNVVSHRSGETEDTFITHLVVGTGAGQIKTGGPSRGERTAKYNELMRIEEGMGL